MDGIIKRGYQATASQPPNQEGCWLEIQTQISSHALLPLRVIHCAKPVLNDLMENQRAFDKKKRLSVQLPGGQIELRSQSISS